MVEAQSQMPFAGPAPAPDEKKPGLFGGKRIEGPQGGVEVINELSNLNRASKALEDKYSNLRNKVQVMDQNMLTHSRKTSAETKALTEELDEFKRELEDIKEKIRLIIRELKLTAKADDLKVLQNYIDLWEPVNFVTRNQVEKIVRDILKEEK